MKKMLALSLISIGLFAQGCSKSNEQRLFDSCVTVGMIEQMAGMEESDRTSVKVGVHKGCELVTKECNKQPEGEWCVAFKQKFNSEQ